MPDPTDPGVTNLVGMGINVGAFTLVGWLVRHTFQHTIPRLASEFSKALKENSDAFVLVLTRMRDDAASERKDFLTALDKLRDEFRQDREKLVAKIDELRR